MLFQGCLQIRNREKCLLLSSPKTTCHPSLCQFNAPPPNTEEFFSSGGTIAPTTPTLVHNLEGHLYGARATKTSLESRGGRYPSARVSKSFKVTEPSLTCNYFIFIKCSIWFPGTPGSCLGTRLCGNEAAVWEQNKTREWVVNECFMKYLGSFIKEPKALTACKMSHPMSP